MSSHRAVSDYFSRYMGQPTQKADAVLVIKSDKRLYLMNKGEPFASLPVTFGGQPEGHKRKRGDQKTPEGNYVLDYKNVNSRFYKSIHISYPNDGRTEQMLVGLA